MKKGLVLSEIEACHLLTLLVERQEEGSYYGNRTQYYVRTRKLIERLLAYINERRHP